MADSPERQFVKGQLVRIQEKITPDSTQDQVRDLLRNDFAPSLGAFSEEATQLIDDNFDKLYGALTDKSGNGPELITSALGL